uniref:F-box domain-containing protein n=1 Tax=Sphaeramia orbicularis TaxID=375764 RepID=A0A673A8D5_9TELE
MCEKSLLVGSESGSGWASLPDVCLLHILQFLPDGDRISAIQVCHHWHTVMVNCPSLWHSCCFHLRGQQAGSRSEYLSTIGYAQPVGVYLKKLEIHVITFYHYPKMTYLLWRCKFNVRCNELPCLSRVRAQLQSFSLIGLALPQACWTKKLRTLLFNSVINFLHRGSVKLTSVSLVNMRTAIDQSWIPSRCHITHLNLEGFFSSALPVSINTNVAAVMSALHHLTDLTLSYSCVSDELLLLDTQENGRPLQTLSLYCTVHEPHSQVKWIDSWASLVSNCPDLKVKLTVDHIINRERLMRILLPKIPLTEFSMRGFYSYNNNWSGKPLLLELLLPFSLSLQVSSEHHTLNHTSISSQWSRWDCDTFS